MWGIQCTGIPERLYRPLSNPAHERRFLAPLESARQADLFQSLQRIQHLRPNDVLYLGTQISALSNQATTVSWLLFGLLDSGRLLPSGDCSLDYSMRFWHFSPAARYIRRSAWRVAKSLAPSDRPLRCSSLLLLWTKRHRTQTRNPKGPRRFHNTHLNCRSKPS